MCEQLYFVSSDWADRSTSAQVELITLWGFSGSHWIVPAGWELKNWQTLMEWGFPNSRSTFVYGKLKRPLRKLLVHRVHLSSTRGETPRLSVSEITQCSTNKAHKSCFLTELMKTIINVSVCATCVWGLPCSSGTCITAPAPKSWQWSQWSW